MPAIQYAWTRHLMRLPSRKFLRYKSSQRSPISLYNRLLKKGTIVDNAAQRDVLSYLESLHKELDGYSISKYFGSQSLLNDAVDKTDENSFTRSFMQLLGVGNESTGNNNSAPSTESPKGLYIHGGPGTGKTLVMDLLFECARVRRKRRVHFHSFMLNVHERIHQWRQSRQLDENDSARKYDPIPPLSRSLSREAHLLCFDEFQVTDIADAVILNRLFEQLFARGVVMVATSNRAPKDLYQNGLQRELFLPCIDLIQQRCHTVSLDSEIDFRTIGIQLINTFMSPIDDGRKQFDKTWRQVTDDKPCVAKEIAVMQGRTLDAQETVHGAARFSFDELCRQPLGAADYCAIAAEFHTVFLSGIPLLNLEQRNEMRRFITLIDELYQAKIRLICLAAAPPQQLFHEINNTHYDEVFSFGRCVSRLVEMQSKTYNDALDLRLKRYEDDET